MNNLLRILFCYVLISCNNSTSTNSIACKKVEEQLSIINVFVSGKAEGRPIKEAVDAISFLEKLTGMMSQSDINDDIGKFNPTSLDHNKWQDWYKTYKDRLDWDAKKKEVIIKPAL